MSKGLKTLVLLLVLGLSFNSKKTHAAFGISQDHPMLKICESATNIGLILSQYPMPHLWPSIQVLPFPPFIAPGLVVGFASRTAVIVEMCNLLHDIAALDTQGAIYAIGRATNNLTEDKWDHHLNMADKTWNLANTFYDFEAGGQRKGVLQSASAHREINDYMRTSYGWFNKSFNGSDAQLKNRGEREQEMNQYANLVSRRAILAEAISCPDASTNPNYDRIYQFQIKPHEQKRQYAQDDILFLKSKLLEMGPKFMNNQEELEEYVKGIEDIETLSVTYKITNATKTETSKKPGTRKDKEGHIIMVDKPIKRTIQRWTTTNFASVVEQFKNRWGPQWSSWVTAQYSQTSRGFLVGGADRVENEFKDLNFECNPNRLMRGIDVNRQDYEKFRDEQMEKCRRETPIKQKKAENLLNYYATQFQVELKKFKDANAAIWTVESEELGMMRTVSTGKSTDGYQQEAVVCADANKMTEAEMEILKRKQKSVTVELEEMIAKQYIKKTSIQQMGAKSAAESSEEANKRMKFAEGQAKRSNDNLKNNIAPVAVEGGI